MLSGFYLFTDNKRVLLSSLLIVTPDDTNPFGDLKHPLFIYVACVLTAFGMLIVSISFVGYWTALLNNCCLLASYFIMVLFLLVVKFSVCIIITIWPQSLGLNFNGTEMVRTLQGSYGVPGYEQYSIALDFAVITFSSNIRSSDSFVKQFTANIFGLLCNQRQHQLRYVTMATAKVWQKRANGALDLLCLGEHPNGFFGSLIMLIFQLNKFEKNSYLDPSPINLTQCQSLIPQDFSRSRHIEVC